MLYIHSFVIFMSSVFGIFPWLVGQYCSYLLPKQAQATCVEKHNKTWRKSWWTTVYIKPIRTFREIVIVWKLFSAIFLKIILVQRGFFTHNLLFCLLSPFIQPGVCIQGVSPCCIPQKEVNYTPARRPPAALSLSFAHSLGLGLLQAPQLYSFVASILIVGLSYYKIGKS